MSDETEYRFKINAYTPSTIPMARLSEYMRDLAEMFGEDAHVHFGHLEEGSTVVVSRIENEAVPKVRKRVASARRRDGQVEAVRAYQRINRRLVEDNGNGLLTDENAAEIIPFPGVDDRAFEALGPFRQQGAIDGVIIRMGGKGRWIPMIVESDGREISGCRVRRELALALRPYLMETQLRLFGEGRWQRDEHGTWLLDKFYISTFAELDDASLSDAVKKIQAIRGMEWDDLKDPIAELQRLRQEPDEPS